MEICKIVKNCGERFLVSDSGKIKSARSGKEIKTLINKQGYEVFSTKIGGRLGTNKLFRVHRIVAECFLEPPSKDLLDWAAGTKYGLVLVNHKDLNKQNNTPSNLEWCTASYNSSHYWESTCSKPRPSKTRKLTKEAVLYIRDNYTPRCRVFGARALARKFDIAHMGILDIVKRKSYVDVR